MIPALHGFTPNPPGAADCGLYAIFDIPIPLREGAKFAAWNDDDDGFGPVEAVNSVGCSGGKNEFCAGGGGGGV
jgi:hypothetical protein